MLLEIKDLSTCYLKNSKRIPALENISLTLGSSEVLGIVGESGSGKSSLAFTLLKLFDESSAKTESGEILFEDQNLLSLPEKEMEKIRGSRISMIFQEPSAFLNPSMTIKTQLMETLSLHQPSLNAAEKYRLCLEILKQLGIKNAEQKIKAYPFELSGGQLQRMMIAMSLLGNPKLLIADEPTTALDVFTERQIIDLLFNIRKQRSLSILLISHNLTLVASMAQTIAVMYCGRLVEWGTTENILNHPRHPYTRLLLSCQKISSEWQEMPTIQGAVPDFSRKPQGCLFHPRCPKAQAVCRITSPEYRELSPTHKTACLFAS